MVVAVVGEVTVFVPVLLELLRVFSITPVFVVVVSVVETEGEEIGVGEDRDDTVGNGEGVTAEDGVETKVVKSAASFTVTSGWGVGFVKSLLSVKLTSSWNGKEVGVA